MKKAVFAVLVLLAGLLCFGTAQAADRVITFQWQQDMCPDLDGWKLDISLDGVTWGQEADWIDIDFVEEQTSYTSEQTLSFTDGTTTTLYARILAYDTAGNKSAWSDVASGVIDMEGPLSPKTFTFTIRMGP